MFKKLIFLLLLVTSGTQLIAQSTSIRFGTMPYQWLWRQGVPGFVELGIEYAPHERWSIIAHYKLLDDSMKVDKAWERPANEIGIQPRFYFSLEEFNSGAFISAPISYARYWNYIAVNAVTLCETKYYQEYIEYSLFLGYKLDGRLAFEFFGGPSWRQNKFLQNFYLWRKCRCSPNTGYPKKITARNGYPAYIPGILI